MTVMPLPAFPRLANLSDDELGLVTVMNNRLTLHQGPNNEAESFYDGTHVAQNFGISTPPRMSHLRTVAGWGGTVVDVLEERLDWLGWTSELDDFGLDEVYAENQLDVDSGMAHLDALIFGISFVTVGAGYDGEPSPLITPHSPKSLTVQWDRRTRRASAAWLSSRRTVAPSRRRCTCLTRRSWWAITAARGASWSATGTTGSGACRGDPEPRARLS